MTTPLEDRVDTLLREFNAWFQAFPSTLGRPHEPLIYTERMIIKSFCYWLTHTKERSKMPVLEETLEDAQPSGSSSVQPVLTSGDAGGASCGT